MAGKNGFSSRLRWWLRSVVLPLIGVAALIDQMFIRLYLFGEPVDPWRLVISLGLIGVIPLGAAIGTLGGKK